MIESVVDEVAQGDRAPSFEVNLRALLVEALARAGRSREAQAQARLVEELRARGTVEDQSKWPEAAEP